MKTPTRFAAALSVAAALLLAATVTTTHAEDAKPAGTAVISGKVTDASGNPAANIRVSLNLAGAKGEKPTHTAKDPNKKGAKGAAALATTTTDAQGEYKFEGLAAGDYVVAANGKGVGHGMEKVTVKDGEKATADIKLTAPKKPAAK